MGHERSRHLQVFASIIIRTKCDRPLASILVKTLARMVSTVRGLMVSASAIAELESPSVRPARTCRSVGERVAQTLSDSGAFLGARAIAGRKGHSHGTKQLLVVIWLFDEI